MIEEVNSEIPPVSDAIKDDSQKNSESADSCTIVLIDDDRPTCETISRMIVGNTNHKVFYECDGRKGLDLVLQKKPDLVILDIRMPQPDGLRVLEAIKTYPETMPIPVIMLTGKNCEKSFDSAMSWYAEAYLTKPCDRKGLIDVISAALSRPRYRYPASENPYGFNVRINC